MLRRRSFLLSLLIPLVLVANASAETIKLGFIGSLTGFASSYGQAVLDGAQLAVDELKRNGNQVELIVEDDHSVSKDTVSAFVKLRTVDHVQGLIGGSWWVNSIAKQTETYKIPLLSCETLYNKDFVKADTYFSLGGDLRDWIRVFDPLIAARHIKSAATVKFTSGFADTIAEEMKNLFSKDNRRYLGNVEYADLNMADVAGLVLKVRQLNPEAVFVDGQPSSFTTFAKKLLESEQKNLIILTNSIADDAISQGLIDASSFNDHLFFTKRESYSPEFATSFFQKYKRSPVLSADLGYYAVLIFTQVLKEPGDPTSTIKGGVVSVNNLQFKFDENNVWHGISQQIWTIANGKVIRAQY